MTIEGIELQGFNEFRKSLRNAEGATPRETTRVLKAAGTPLKERAEQLAPQETGRLASSFKVRVRAARAELVNPLVYAPVMEFAERGRWRNLTARIGRPPPRFGYRALRERADVMVEMISSGLEEIVSAHGWFR